MDLKQQLSALPHLGVTDLRSLYCEVFGEPTKANNRDWLSKRLAWRLQAKAMGGLSERAQQRVKELANEADLRTTPPPTIPMPIGTIEKRDPRLPVPGSVLSRTYKDQTHLVEVMVDMFTYNGHMYSSLTAVAKAITGQHLNGFAFFGITKEKAQ